MRSIFTFFTLFLSLPLFSSTCLICHGDKQQETAGSVHDRANISCHHCHGGDPTQMDMKLSMSADAETGFVGIPSKKQIALMCGGCHADVEFMNFYGIRTDQLTRYQTSIHGKQLFENDDDNVATCTDCHGHHNVTSSKDFNSPVFPSNLPEMCDRCHGDEKLMDSYGLSSDVFEKYRKSVHGIALLEKGDVGVAHCASCHGSHGAVPPGVKDVSSTCGKCHINEKKHFLESVHATVAQEGVFSECDSCHGHHTVQPATLELYHEACEQCHDKDSAEAIHGRIIHEKLLKYHDSLDKTERVVKQAAIEGFFVEKEEAQLEEIKTKVVVSEPEQHTLSIAKISEHQEAIVDAAEAVIEKIDQKRQYRKWRKLALIPVWIFILLMAWALWVAYQRLKFEEKDDEIKEIDEISRRDFLEWVIKGGIVTTVVGFVVPAIAYLWPVMRQGPVSMLTEVGTVDEFPMWGAKKVVIAGSAVLVMRTPQGFKAVSAICTHLGCIVAWSGQKHEIECPCHAASFDADGKVLSGPPPRPLSKYTVEVHDGKVFVKL